MIEGRGDLQAANNGPMKVNQDLGLQDCNGAHRHDDLVQGIVIRCPHANHLHDGLTTVQPHVRQNLLRDRLENPALAHRIARVLSWRRQRFDDALARCCCSRARPGGGSPAAAIRQPRDEIKHDSRHDRHDRDPCRTGSSSREASNRSDSEIGTSMPSRPQTIVRYANACRRVAGLFNPAPKTKERSPNSRSVFALSVDLEGVRINASAHGSPTVASPRTNSSNLSSPKSMISGSSNSSLKRVPTPMFTWSRSRKSDRR